MRARVTVELSDPIEGRSIDAASEVEALGPQAIEDLAQRVAASVSAAWWPPRRGVRVNNGEGAK